MNVKISGAIKFFERSKEIQILASDAMIKANREERLKSYLIDVDDRITYYDLVIKLLKKQKVRLWFESLFHKKEIL